MCRQFYRYCRDCHEMFPMPEPDMREPCKAFQKAQILRPHLQTCPENEIQAIRPPSGHGVKVCGPCRRNNREDQRQRENAQKRARRAKLKRQKMTAGIGKGNVVWTAPKIWRPTVTDARNFAPHSPQPQRPRLCNILKVESTTQALQYALNDCISTATMTQDHVDVSHHDRGVYSQYCQTFATTTSNILQPQVNCDDMMATEMHDDANMHHEYESEQQDVALNALDGPSYRKQMHEPVGLGVTLNNEVKSANEPAYQEQKCQPVGLGITINNDAEWDPINTEACPLDEGSFRMELNKWSSVFDDDEDGNPHDAKEC